MFIIYTHLPSPKSFHRKSSENLFFSLAWKSNSSTKWRKIPTQNQPKEKRIVVHMFQVGGLLFPCLLTTACILPKELTGVMEYTELWNVMKCFQRWDFGATDEWPCFSSGRLASDFRPTRSPTPKPRFVVHYMCGLYGWFSIEQFHAASVVCPQKFDLHVSRQLS